MNKIALLGSANALKSKIIIEQIVEMELIPLEKIIFYTDNDKGIALDYCLSKSIKTINFDNDKYFKKKISLKMIKEQQADILVSIGWPYKISKTVLDLFPYNPINCHGSVLPDYKGSRSYMHYWANIENHYGASIHYMNENFDDGRIIIRGKLKLYFDETQHIIHRRTAELCAYLLPQAINLVKDDFIGKKPIEKGRYFNKLSPEEFVFYRKRNEELLKNGKEKILTPFKIE